MSDIVKQVINLNNKGKKPLSEYVFNDFANQVRNAVSNLMLMGFDIPYKLSGTRSQIDSFMKSLHSEKNYMESYIKHGLYDQRTLNSRHKLMDSVKKFELETGLRWPFKN